MCYALFILLHCLLQFTLIISTNSGVSNVQNMQYEKFLPVGMNCIFSVNMIR